MNKLTIVLSGKKQAGKSSTCNHIRAKYLNLKQKYFEFKINEEGLLCADAWIPVDDAVKFLVGAVAEDDELLKRAAKDGKIRVTYDNTQVLVQSVIDKHSVKVYSFADPLKDFCINVLGVPYECCWGTDEQKNCKHDHLLWENLPESLRPTRKIERNGESSFDYAEGPMSGREIMQLFGTEICRKLYGDCWARGTYNKIKAEGFELALVADARFPNEISMGTTVKAKTVRLSRKIADDNHASEMALDNFPTNQYSLYIDNTNLTLKEQCELIDPYLDQWFEEAGIK